MTNGTFTITLSDDERTDLERLIANRNTPAKVVWRAEIVLATARGLGTGGIHKETGKDKTTIWRWQQRYLDEGIEGLKRDKTRPPGTPPLSEEIKAKVSRRPRPRRRRTPRTGRFDRWPRSWGFRTPACSGSGAKPASSRIL